MQCLAVVAITVCRLSTEAK